MNIFESIRVALEGIIANKMRSILTTLGIVIGIASVIAVVAIGQGGRVLLMTEMEKIGTNIFHIGINWKKEVSWTGHEFALHDVDAIKSRIPEVTFMSPISRTTVEVRGERKKQNTSIYGVNSDYTRIRNFTMKEGRFFSQDDDQGRRRVAVIQEDLAEILFGRENPIGKKVVLGSTPFVVTGIIDKSSKSMLDGGQSTEIYIPVQTFHAIFFPSIFYLEGSAASKDKVEDAMNKSIKVLERRHQLPDHYAGESMEQIMQTADKFTGIITLIISAIAGISLLVGGIGVMNIMLVSVTERTREIGIRMALGARRRDILMQFLIESIVLCLLGGVIGMTLGVGGAFLIAKIAKWPPLVSWGTVMVAFTFSAVVGVLFGILPANKAARLDPIEALRRD
ncbi:MAG: ABC transporter permease [Bacillota bacterium]